MHPWEQNLQEMNHQRLHPPLRTENARLTASPEKHHRSREPICLLAAPVVPNLGDQLDAPQDCPNRAQNIGCQSDIFTFGHGEGDVMICTFAV